MEVRRTWQLWSKVLVATLPLLLVFKLDDWFDTHFHNMVSVAIMLIIYGVAFIYLEKEIRRKLLNQQSQNLKKASLQDSSLYRTLPSPRPLPRNEPFRCDDCRWFVKWNESLCRNRVYLLPRIPVMFGASALKIFKFIKAGQLLSFGQLFLLLVAME